MGKKSGPPPPDYQALSKQQAGESKELATQNTWADRANQENPWGNLTWGTEEAIDPATGQKVTKWTSKQTLDPGLQGALDDQFAIQGQRSDIAAGLMDRARGELTTAPNWNNFVQLQGAPQGGGLQTTTGAFGFGGPRQTTSARGGGLYATTPASGGAGDPFAQQIDTSRDQAPTLNTGLGGYAGEGLRSGLDFSGAQDVTKAADTRKRAEDAIYQSATSRLDPQFQQQQAKMEADLANRGITRGSAAYQKQMDQFGRTRNDAYQQAMMGSITGGGAEAQRDYGMDLGLRQQQVGEEAQAAGFQNAAQQQAFSQRFGSEQAQNEALGQQFGFGQSARNQQLQAQQAALGQQQQGFSQMLGQQQQAFGQNLNLDQAALQRQQQAYAQSMGLDQSQLAREGQAFGQQQAAGSQNFQQQLQAAQFQNQLRQQQVAEDLQQRGFTLNQINSILSGQQVSMPQFAGYNSATGSQGADLVGAAQKNQQAAQDQAAAAAAGRGQVYSALGTAAAMYFSDRRIKKDVRRIGRHPAGFGIYSYRFVGERGRRRVGVMAQEVRRVRPDAVADRGGVLTVRYAALGMNGELA